MYSCVEFYFIFLSVPSRRPRHEVYSIPSLFSLLISNPPSPHYAATFFLTYRMFTNAHEVLDAVIEGHKKELDARNVR